MLKQLFTLALTISILRACSPAPGWVPSTIADQVNHASAVIYGRVDSVTQNPDQVSSYIHLTNTVFYKGCGPSYVRINGFTSSAACGLDPPAVNTWVIVFVCRDGFHWKLNNINLHTGMVPATYTNRQTVIRLTSNYPGCDGCRVRYYRCTKPIITTFATGVFQASPVK